MTAHTLSPVRSSERYVILDALRGFALLGICMANFPEFSLFTFLKPEAAAALPTAAIDQFVRYLTYVFVDGKFYTLFSLLFGIGFSLIITHAMQKGADGFRIFYRRMTVLAVIGFLHLMFIWSGDILMLYALLGLLLPCFRHVSDRGLLTWAAILLIVLSSSTWRVKWPNSIRPAESSNCKPVTVPSMALRRKTSPTGCATSMTMKACSSF